MGFNMLFHIILGTNLLTGGPVPVYVFLPILEFYIKGIPNEVQKLASRFDGFFGFPPLPRRRDPASGSQHTVGVAGPGGWYVSNVSMIFDCSMLLYYLFWMFNGLYYTLLYYFWDLPINWRPSPNCCFFVYFSVSQKRNMK